MLTALASFVASVIVAVVTAWLTVHWSLKRFRAEQWWSRKADAYSAVLEALHFSMDCDSHCIDEVEQHRELSAEFKEDLFKRGREADHQIRKAIDTSRFLFCKDAITSLDELRAGLAAADSADDYLDHLGTCYAAIKKCLGVLPDIAKKDLGVA